MNCSRFAASLTAPATTFSARSKPTASLCDALREAQKLGFAEADPRRHRRPRRARQTHHSGARRIALQRRPGERHGALDLTHRRGGFRIRQQLGCTIRQISWAEFRKDSKTESQEGVLFAASALRWSNSRRRWHASKAAKTWSWPPNLRRRNRLWRPRRRRHPTAVRSSPTSSPSPAPAKCPQSATSQPDSPSK